jgi:hypothetical protein
VGAVKVGGGDGFTVTVATAVFVQLCALVPVTVYEPVEAGTIVPELSPAFVNEKLAPGFHV